MNIELRFPNMTSTLQVIGCHFGFKPPGWSFPKHHHHLFELLYCWSGEVRQTIDNRTVTVREGDWLLLKPGVRHQLENKSENAYSFFDVHFDIDDADMRKLLSRRSYGHVIQTAAERTRLPGYRDEIERLLQVSLAEQPAETNETLLVQLPNVRKLAVQGTILLMLHELIPLIDKQEQASPDGEPKQFSAFETDIAHAIEEKLRDIEYAAGAVEEVARDMKMSRSQCSKVFAKIYGISPRQYISQLKLNQAKQLLVRSGLTIEAIARQLGFSSVSHFSRQFRRWTGLSPNQYRPKHSVPSED